jgi:hypothetical protein
MYAVIPFFLLLNCNENKGKTNKELSQNDTIKPQTKISVYKEYDEKGNLISLDSSYSYFYSNIKNDSILEKEIFKKFKLDFHKNFMPIDSLSMSDLFQSNLFKLNEFYTDEFFQNNLKLQQEQMTKIYKRLDSIKNIFYKKQFLIE